MDIGQTLIQPCRGEVCASPRADYVVEKSLVRFEGDRFRMLETIREFATEQLEELGATSDVVRRHADYFARLVEEGEPDLRGPSQPQAIERLDTEFDNIRAALEEAAEAARASRSQERHMWLLEGLADLALPFADPILAARLSGASDALAARIRSQRFPVDEAARGRRVSALAVALGEPEYDRRYAEGRAPPAEEALRLGLSVEPLHARQPPSRRDWREHWRKRAA